MRDWVNLGRLAHRLIRLQTALGVDEVGGEDGVDERRLPETSLAYETSGSVSRGANHVMVDGGTYQRQ